MSIEDCWQRLRSIMVGDGPQQKCKEIIHAAEALPELTPKERTTYLTALDEYECPDWSSDEECDAADERD